VRFHHEARTDVLAGMPESAPMLHWHGDAFDLPSGAQLLASTEVWRNQAFQLGQRAFGLQFHCEMTAESIETIVVADAPFAVRANGVGAEETIRRDTRELLPICERFGDRLLGNMLRAMAG
jgi:GMP synthase (glutamine-hydrolysing)